MTHFAKLSGTNLPIQPHNYVLTVIVADQSFVDDQPGIWVQTSYNTRGNVHYAPNSNTPDGGVAINKNFAGIGFIYVDGKGFHAPQPFPSWALDDDTFLWNPPVAYPSDGERDEWNEETTTWVEA